MHSGEHTSNLGRLPVPATRPRLSLWVLQNLHCSQNFSAASPGKRAYLPHEHGRCHPRGMRWDRGAFRADLVLFPLAVPLQTDAPSLLEEMRQQNLLNTLQLFELDATAPETRPDAPSTDTPTELYQQMHAILDKVGTREKKEQWVLMKNLIISLFKSCRVIVLSACTFYVSRAVEDQRFNICRRHCHARDHDPMIQICSSKHCGETPWQNVPFACGRCPRHACNSIPSHVKPGMLQECGSTFQMSKATQSTPHIVKISNSSFAVSMCVCVLCIRAACHGQPNTLG